MYDVIILGIGPAGMSAAIYAARYNMKVLLLGTEKGGTINQAHLIDNYLGIPNITGEELSEKFFDHVKRFENCEIKNTIVNSIQKINNTIYVATKDGQMYEGKNIILAIGADRKKANIKNESEFLGKGLSYCAVCDGMFYKDKTVVVVGDGEPAVKGVKFLSNIANKIYLITDSEKINSDDEVLKNPKVEIFTKTKIKEVNGNGKVEKIIIEKENKEEEISINGIFIEIGSVPQSVMFKGLGLDITETGFIKINNDCQTNVENIYAVGDMTTGFSNLKQIVVAAAMGAIASTSIKKNLK